MKKFVILPDVTCDLSQEMREFFGLNDYIRGHVNINDKEFTTTLDWNEISRAEFYKILGNKRNKVSSAAASPEEYYQAFKACVEQGADVLSMSISSTISGTYSIAATAAKRVMEEYPQSNIYCLDTKRMSGSFGLLVAYALQLQKQGKSLEEVAAWLEENKNRVHQMGPIDDLTFIARRGKISKGKAFMGNLVGIKPMGDSNEEGYVTALGKVKGMKKALEITVAYIQKTATDLKEQYIFITHSDREAYALALKELLEKSVECKGVFVGDVFDACGTNIGPGMVCAYFLGEPISKDCEKEKEILLKAIEENA